MPYIRQDLRRELDPSLECGDMVPDEPGELAYYITRVIQDYLPSEPRYPDYASVLGVLETVKQEFYRRVVVPYEDNKRADNGDVY